MAHCTFSVAFLNIKLRPGGVFFGAAPDGDAILRAIATDGDGRTLQRDGLLLRLEGAGDDAAADGTRGARRGRRCPTASPSAAPSTPRGKMGAADQGSSGVDLSGAHVTSIS